MIYRWAMSVSSILPRSKIIMNAVCEARGNIVPFLVAAILAVGVMMFMPSQVINLRMQESLFPLIAITMALCAMISPVSVSITAFGFFVVMAAMVRFTPDSYAFLILTTYYLALYHLATSWRRLPEHQEMIFDVICIFALVNVVWIVMQANGIYLIFQPLYQGSTETGWFANRNESGAFLAICLPLFFRRKAIWGILPITYGIYTVKCTNGMIAGCTVAGLYLCYLLCRNLDRKKAAAVVAGIALAAMLVVGLYMTFVHQGGWRERLKAYKAAIVLVMDKPVFGWGIGQSPYLVPLWMNAEKNPVQVNAAFYERVYYQGDFRKLYIEKHDYKNDFTEIWTHLHNEYLQWGIDAGMVGLLLLALVIAAHLRRAWQNRAVVPGLALVASLVTANAFFTFQIGRLLFLTVIFAALVHVSDET